MDTERNGEAHASLLLQRTRYAERMQVLLELTEEVRAELERLNREIAAHEQGAVATTSEGMTP